MAKDKILYFRPMWRVLRILAFPLSLVYACVVLLRNVFYDKGWFASKSYAVTTICVGNLSVGGTGKTPMVEYLLNLLSHKKLAVLSRGYKRKSKGFVMADSNTSVSELGDEPFQIVTKFPSISLAVDANRQAGIEKLVELVNPEMILLDDAYQHRKVTASFYILLTTYSNLYVDDWYLPAGTLRDAKRESRRASIIVITKCPGELSQMERQLLVEKLKPESTQTILFSWFAYGDFARNGSGMTMEWEAMEGKKIAVVTGIASPKPFVNFLKSKQIQFDHLAFADHHFFTESEVEKFRQYDMVLTTEKDYVRLEGRIEELFYVEVSHTFSKEDTDTLKMALSNLT